MTTGDLLARLPSIRRRLTATAIAGVIATAIVSAAVAALAVSFVVEDLMKSSLEETAQALVVLAEHEREVAAEALSHGRALPAAPHDEALVWQLRTPDGAIVARSHSAPVEPWPVPLFEGHQQTRDLAVFTIAGQRLWLQVAQPLADLHQAQVLAAAQAAAAVLLLSLLAAVLLALQIRRELRPVRQLAADVEAIEPGHVAPHLPRSPRQELEPVYQALERLGQRLAHQLRSERAFSAHAAHSLRTPLAGMSAQIELLLGRAPDELRPKLQLALDATRRLSGVVEALLTMARSGGAARTREFGAVALAPAALARRIAVDSSRLRTIELHGDPDLLAVAVANLVDNAARHGAGKVRMAAGREGSSQWIEVLDDGPGVAAERLAALRAALATFDASGFVDETLGLGLTLAAMVARAHGGIIELGPLPDSSGFAVRLKW
jgi:two-component system OmpR family sensor kinase